MALGRTEWQEWKEGEKHGKVAVLRDYNLHWHEAEELVYKRDWSVKKEEANENQKQDRLSSLDTLCLALITTLCLGVVIRKGGKASVTMSNRRNNVLWECTICKKVCPMFHKSSVGWWCFQSLMNEEEESKNIWKYSSLWHDVVLPKYNTKSQHCKY